MLKNTFIHIPGVGRTTERALWDKGIRSWDDVVRLSAAGVRPALAARVQDSILSSQRALAEKNASFFSPLSRIGEAWRVFGDFADRCVYLDIETTGLSPVFNTITVVGLYDGDKYELFVDGQNLDQLPNALKRYSVVVTFNGAQFDLRFLRSVFPAACIPPIHIDLRWLTQRLGHRGGLKNIEVAFGLRRPVEVADLSGYDATVLWSKYLRGDEDALRLLVQYNTQDVVNLKHIMERSYHELASNTASFVRPARRSRQVSSPLPNVSNPAEATNVRSHSSVGLVRSLIGKSAERGRGARIVGIDLTGSERRATGWALLDGGFATTALIKSDAELLSATIAAKPDLVSIDSPLSLPGGKKTPLECRRSGLPIYRACELALKRMGISVFWCLLPSMESLTMRGISLARDLRAAGIPVIESYPGAAQDLLRIPRKGTSLEELAWGLHGAGIEGDFIRQRTSHDEIDAITSALVGLFYVADEYIQLGNVPEDYLIVPRSSQIDYNALAAILEQSGLDPMAARGVAVAMQVA